MPSVRRLMLALLVACLPSMAHAADDKELARHHFETGRFLYARGDYADALKELEAARASFGNVLLDYNIGLCLEALDWRFEAADAFQRFAEGSQDLDAVNATWKRIAKLRMPRPDANGLARERWRAKARVLRIVGGALAGEGVGGLLSIIPFGLQTVDERDAYRRSCAAGPCDTALFHHAHALGVATDGVLGVSITLTVAGIALLGVSARHARPVVTEAAKAAP